MYEIEVEVTVRAGHAIRLYDGSVEPLHEHDWRVVATVRSPRLDAIDVVADFCQVQQWLGEIVGPWEAKDLGEVLAPSNPTAERVAARVFHALAGRFAEPVTLAAVAVQEAPGCWARYRGEM